MAWWARAPTSVEMLQRRGSGPYNPIAFPPIIQSPDSRCRADSRDLGTRKAGCRLWTRMDMAYVPLCSSGWPKHDRGFLSMFRISVFRPLRSQKDKPEGVVFSLVRPGCSTKNEASCCRIKPRSRSIVESSKRSTDSKPVPNSGWSSLPTNGGVSITFYRTVSAFHLWPKTPTS